MHFLFIADFFIILVARDARDEGASRAWRSHFQRAAEQKSFLGPPPAAQKNLVCAAGGGPSPYLGQFLSFWSKKKNAKG